MTALIPVRTPAPAPSRSSSLAILAKGSRSFSFASRFLRPSDRLDAATVYAFCRLADDSADDADHPEAGRTALSGLRDQLYGRRPANSVLGAFLEVANRRGIDVGHADELLLGVESDLDRVRVETDEQLVRYGYRVAGTVGLLMCPIIGVHHREAFPFAVDLGVAMQVTNICRDVAEDAALGRIYLPSSRLRAAGVKPDALLKPDAWRDGEVCQGVSVVVRDLVELADTYYRSGQDGFRFIPLRPRIAIAVASRVYRAIGTTLVTRGAAPWRGRTIVSTWEKVFYALSALPLLRTRQPAHHAADLHRALVGLPGANPKARPALADAVQLSETQGIVSA